MLILSVVIISRSGDNLTVANTSLVHHKLIR